MWPWEHAAVGYLCYSVAARSFDGRTPDGNSVLALLVGTQLPDLVDKPLSWGLGWFPSGYAAGHSALVALPLAATAVAIGYRTDRLRPAVAFVVGHLSHLAGDLLGPVRRGAAAPWNRVLWPVLERPPYATDLGLARGLAYLAGYVDALGSADLRSLVVVHLALTAGTAVLWVRDGAPGPRALARHLRRVASAASRQ